MKVPNSGEEEGTRKATVELLSCAICWRWKEGNRKSGEEPFQFSCGFAILERRPGAPQNREKKLAFGLLSLDCRRSPWTSSGVVWDYLNVNGGRMEAALRGMNKKFNKVEKYGVMLENLRKRGISYSLNFIFGWDNETPEVFSSTLEFLHREKVPVAYFNILCPEIGTMFYEKMQKEGRILRATDIGRFPGEFCHLQPKYITAKEMEQKVQEAYLQFYSWKSMFQRLPMPLTQATIASWVVNLSQRTLAQLSWGNNNNNFDAF
jgi:hypothetical protein